MIINNTISVHCHNNLFEWPEFVTAVSPCLLLPAFKSPPRFRVSSAPSGNLLLSLSPRLSWIRAYVVLSVCGVDFVLSDLFLAFILFSVAFTSWQTVYFPNGRLNYLLGPVRWLSDLVLLLLLFISICSIIRHGVQLCQFAWLNIKQSLGFRGVS